MSSIAESTGKADELSGQPEKLNSQTLWRHREKTRPQPPLSASPRGDTVERRRRSTCLQGLMSKRPRPSAKIGPMNHRQLKLGAFMRPVSIHTGAWRYLDSEHIVDVPSPTNDLVDGPCSAKLGSV